MSKKRYVNLVRYGISNERRMELVAFALQYQEWLDSLKKKESPKLRYKVNLVDDIARRGALDTCGDPGLAEYVLKSVTEDRPYWYLKEIMGMPYRDKDFYDARKRFFVLLNQEKD